MGVGDAEVARTVELSIRVAIHVQFLISAVDKVGTRPEWIHEMLFWIREMLLEHQLAACVTIDRVAGQIVKLTLKCAGARS